MNNKNVIIITHWTGGDVYPFIKLGVILKSAGYKVTVLTHCVYEKTVLDNDLNFKAVDSEEEYEVMNNSLYKLSDPIGNVNDYVDFHKEFHGKDRLLREVKLIESICDEESIIIARFRSSIAGQIAAEKNHLKYVSMILAPNFFSHMELHNQLFGETFKEEINKARKELNLSVIDNWLYWLYSPQYILCGWPNWYAKADETWPKCAAPIGFIKPENYIQNKNPINTKRNDLEYRNSDEEEINKFINEAKYSGIKTVIISAGSSRMIDEKMYAVAVEACIEANMYGIIVTPYSDYIPNPMPKNIRWTTKVPMTTLMDKVDVIINHGGIGTINEAVDAALPQVVMAHLVDRPDNADRLESFGIGKKVSPKMWNPDYISKILIEMGEDNVKEKCIYYQELNKKEYEENKVLEILERLKPTSEYIPVINEKIEKRESNKIDIKLKQQLSKKAIADLLRKKKLEK